MRRDDEDDDGEGRDAEDEKAHVSERIGSF
jgi:hypothetical protein